MAHRDKTRKRISKKERVEVMKRDGYICAYCGKKKKPSSIEIDHVIPVAYGGNHGKENFVTSCKDCNRDKWDSLPKENNTPKLGWHSKKMVAKATCMMKGKKGPKRAPKISYKRVKVVRHRVSNKSV